MLGQEISRQIAIDQEQISQGLDRYSNLSQFKTVLSSLLDKEITEILVNIFIAAIHFRSSDIHIEARKFEALIRFRIDGMLHDVIIVNHLTYKKLRSRLKLLSRVKLNISDAAQDGRFSVLFGEKMMEIRASFLPAEYGEDMVLRILNPDSLLAMSDLGLDDYLERLFRREISQPHGMILVTGPTGSGKTTTLYAFLKELQKPEIKVITIEDPIEYRLKGISQTQVNPKRNYTFARGLRAIVRQDPDVILVGEIRDLETAEIALQAALTGHLVFSTLHTNDAVGAIPRLIDLGARIDSVSPAVSMVIAQRLVRKICQKCAVLKPIPNQLLKERDALLQVSLLMKEFNWFDTISQTTAILYPQGCQDCNSTGYKGRVGIYETFIVDREIEAFILTSPSASALRALVQKKGVITMYQNGLIKVFQNITTFDEIRRVIGEQET